MTQEIIFQAVRIYVANFRKEKTEASCRYSGNKHESSYLQCQDCEDNFGPKLEGSCIALQKIKTKEGGLAKKTKK